MRLLHGRRVLSRSTVPRRHNTIATWILLGGAAVLALNAVGLTRREASRQATVPATPYTVVLRETLVLSDGSVRPGVSYLTAVKADGSIVRRMERLHTTTGAQLAQRTLTFASGERVNMNEIEELKSTVLLPGHRAAKQQRDPASNCLNALTGEPFTRGEIALGEESVAGLRTIKIARHESFSWFSLAVGCALVKFRIETGGGEVTEQLAESLEPGEPNPVLFHIPHRYTEVPPSKLWPLSVSSPGSPARDQFYHANRPRS